MLRVIRQWLRGEATPSECFHEPVTNFDRAETAPSGLEYYISECRRCGVEMTMRRGNPGEWNSGGDWEPVPMRSRMDNGVTDTLKAELRAMPGIADADRSRAIACVEQYRPTAESLTSQGLDPADIAECIRRQVSRAVENHDANP